MEILKTQDIIKQFENHRALSDVSISVEEGTIFGLLGPNGAGKTTLIRIINQITAPDKGEVYLFGEKLKPEHIKNIGYLPEERGLYKKMKVGEQALYFAQLKGMSKQDAKTKLKYWFDKFEISSWNDKKVEELSKGMQQKVQFIITVIHEPKLLIFDEPFSGFDPINTDLLKNEILSLKEKGASVIFSTHNMASVEEICDKIALINKSKKILDGKVSDIKNNYKSNIFKIVFRGNFNKFSASLTADYEIVENIEKDQNSVLKVKILNELKSNDLLKRMTDFGEIISFNEVIPNMHDIFIKAVNGNN
jgi:ABC-2 type transport system ATP-binding protein